MPKLKRHCGNDDKVLLHAISKGDKDAMKVLYERHSTSTRRFLLLKMRDSTEVEDVVHNTMIAVFDNAGKFEGRSSVRAWIFSIARNKATDHIRKTARMDLVAPDETVPDDTPDVVALIVAAKNAQLLRDCLDKLPDHQRTAVYLAFFEELPYREIAEIEQVPKGTIKTRIHHAKKSLMWYLTRLDDNF